MTKTPTLRIGCKRRRLLGSESESISSNEPEIPWFPAAFRVEVDDGSQQMHVQRQNYEEDDIPTDIDSPGSLLDFIASENDEDDIKNGSSLRSEDDDDTMDTSLILPAGTRRIRKIPKRYVDAEYENLMLEDISQTQLEKLREEDEDPTIGEDDEEYLDTCNDNDLEEGDLADDEQWSGNESLISDDEGDVDAFH